MKKQLLLVFTLLFILVGCSSKPIVQEKVDVLNWAGYYVEGDVQTGEWSKFNEEISSQKINYTAMPMTDPLGKWILDLSGNADFQMLSLWPAEYSSLAPDGALLDLKPYLETYAPDVVKAYTQEQWDVVTEPETGAIYGIPRFGQSDTIISTIAWREDILKEKNLEVPTTTDEFLNVTCSLASSGLKTPYALTAGAFQEPVLRGAFGVTYEWNKDDSGQLLHITQDSRYKDYLNFISELNECGALGVDPTEIDQAQAYERFIQGQSAATTINHWNIFQIAQGLEALDKNYLDMLKLSNTITGPNNIAQARQAGPQVDYLISIPNYQEKYVEQVLTYVNSFFTDEIQKEMLFGTQSTPEDPSSGHYIVDDAGKIQKYYKDSNGEIVATQNRDRWVGLEIPTTPEFRKIQREADIEKALALFDANKLTTIEDSNLWYDVVTIKQKSTGVTEPLSSTLITPNYSDVRSALTQAISDFSKTAITENTTDEIWNEFSTKMMEKHNLEEVSKEINDSVK